MWLRKSVDVLADHLRLLSLPLFRMFCDSSSSALTVSSVTRRNTIANIRVSLFTSLAHLCKKKELLSPSCFSEGPLHTVPFTRNSKRSQGDQTASVATDKGASSVE